nr:hypothetical protein Iba_chr05cCG17840 [Ipomoea batatas]
MGKEGRSVGKKEIELQNYRNANYYRHLPSSRSHRHRTPSLLIKPPPDYRRRQALPLQPCSSPPATATSGSPPHRQSLTMQHAINHRSPPTSQPLALVW